MYPKALILENSKNPSKYSGGHGKFAKNYSYQAHYQGAEALTTQAKPQISEI